MSETRNTLHTAGWAGSPPRHIAIIMDGNGRWATQRGLPRTAGHKAGAETFRRIATYCKNIGVKYLTVYAFSTENWKRSETEVSAIMALLKKYLLEAVDTMERDHIRLHFFGDMTPIAPELRALAHETDEITEHLSKDDFQANVCLNAVFHLSGLCRHSGPGADHPPQRGAAAEQLPPVAVRVFRVLLHGCPLAGLR